MESNGIIISDAGVNTVNILIGWSNVFLNVLFFLIVVETSQMIANAYWKWRRDNL